MKKTIASLLVLVLLLSCGLSAFAADAGTEGKDLSTQLKYIATSFNTLKQPESGNPWYYAVTDLDHNGRLELLAYSQQNAISGIAKGWEISPDGSGLAELKIPQGLPNLMTDSAETVYDRNTSTWYYIVHEYVRESDTVEYDVLNGFTLRGGTLENGTFAQRELRRENNQVTVTCYDRDKKTISEDAFFGYVNTAFAGMQHSVTAFDWFTAQEATSLARFADSCAVFNGDKTGAISLRGNQTALTSGFLTITKNPTNENHRPGETALFIANAGNCTGAVWSFVSPAGAVCDAAKFRSTFPNAVVTGENSTTLSIANVSADMSGWAAFCTFTGNGQTVCSTMAYLYVWADSLNRSDLEAFYRTYPYWWAVEWTCPICGSTVYGDYCPHCGYDPDYYYYVLGSGVTDIVETYPWWNWVYDLDADDLNEIYFDIDADDWDIIQSLYTDPDLIPYILDDDDIYDLPDVWESPYDYDWNNGAYPTYDDVDDWYDYDYDDGYWGDVYDGGSDWSQTCPSCGWAMVDGWCTNSNCPNSRNYSGYHAWDDDYYDLDDRYDPYDVWDD